MPYILGRRDSQYCVLLEESGQPVKGGCHSDRAEALRHLQALNINTDKALTASELVVLRYAAIGLSNKEIAFALTCSLPTVASHLVNIYNKMQVGCRCEVLVKSLLGGLIHVENLPALVDESQQIRAKYLSGQRA